ncbi:DUF6334 family protein [Lentisphaera profundi]|uniref:DUF6334 family protein n=1 Tax=Lentisphaera profundi TaxID=1658616 RepID=A0ABY7VTX2_9BACT|nr:DUF6334 family protein [Lentisphaera profundi]WDE95578.1 DUF6334 family protein [Lentisphaera profundi]
MKINTDKITYDYGKLISVYYHESVFDDSPNMLSAIQLKFEHGDVYHEAIIDTDEISCNSDLIETYDLVINKNDKEPWNSLIGNKPNWIWNLNNQQGYDDGIQYEFKTSQTDTHTFQLLVIGSEIKIKNNL